MCRPHSRAVLIALSALYPFVRPRFFLPSFGMHSSVVKGLREPTGM